VPDAAGFEAFYRQNLARVVRACALVTLDRSLAEDISADAFVRLWSRWGQIRNEDHAGRYVFKTAMRLCWREMRRRRRVEAVTAGGGDEIDQALLRHDVGRALASLPVRQRQVVVLRDWAGFETGEVARLLGTRASTVRVHLARARDHLRRTLVMEESER
jgi:RNA polymerase sigma factor (sigma-70 family)